VYSMDSEGDLKQRVKLFNCCEQGRWKWKWERMVDDGHHKREVARSWLGREGGFPFGQAGPGTGQSHNRHSRRNRHNRHAQLNVPACLVDGQVPVAKTFLRFWLSRAPSNWLQMPKPV